MTHKAGDLDQITNYLTEGSAVAFKVMGPIIPIEVLSGTTAHRPLEPL